MKSKLKSIVIVRNPRGYTSTLRFSDPMKDECICAVSKFGLYLMIERIVRHTCPNEFNGEW